MIQRYKIEDLVIQDSTGVVFKAVDEETGLSVSVRRFFPFGVDGGGFDATTQAVYNDCVARFVEIKHPALGSVIEGDCDPVDGMPYLVTEWIDGVSLESILENRPLSQPEVIALIVPLMEVCQLLSHAIGHQGIWVETQFNTITLETGQSHRPVIFQVTPLKCFGDFDEHRGLMPLVELTARITGWHQGVPAHLSATGLGAWLNWLYSACDSASLHEALGNLAIATGVEPPSSVVPKTRSMTRSGQNTTTHPITPSRPVVRPKNAVVPWIVSGLVLVSLSIGAWFLIHKNGLFPTQPVESAPSSIIVKTLDTRVAENPPATTAANEEPPPTEVVTPIPTPEVIPDKAPVIKPAPPKKIINNPVVPPPPTKKEKPPSKTATPPVKPPVKTASPAVPPKPPVIPPEIPVFYAVDQKILQGQEGNQIIVEGTVEEVDLSNSGDTIYLVFIKNRGASSFRVGISSNDAKGTLSRAEMDALIGKKVRTTGKIIIETPSRPVIRINNRSAIHLVK